MYTTLNSPVNNRSRDHGCPHTVSVSSHPHDEPDKRQRDGPLVRDGADHERGDEDAREDQSDVTDTRADGAHSCAIYMYMTRVHGETT